MAKEQFGCTWLVHGVGEDFELWIILGICFSARRDQRPALAQYQMGALHRGARVGNDSGTADWYGRGVELRSLR